MPQWDLFLCTPFLGAQQEPHGCLGQLWRLSGKWSPHLRSQLRFHPWELAPPEMAEGPVEESAGVAGIEADIQVVDDEPAGPGQPADTLADRGSPDGTAVCSCEGGKRLPPVGAGARAARMEVETT